MQQGSRGLIRLILSSANLCQFPCQPSVRNSDVITTPTSPVPRRPCDRLLEHAVRPQLPAFPGRDRAPERSRTRSASAVVPEGSCSSRWRRAGESRRLRPGPRSGGSRRGPDLQKPGSDVEVPSLPSNSSSNSSSSSERQQQNDKGQLCPSGAPASTHTWRGPRCTRRLLYTFAPGLGTCSIDAPLARDCKPIRETARRPLLLLPHNAWGWERVSQNSRGQPSTLAGSSARLASTAASSPTAACFAETAALLSWRRPPLFTCIAIIPGGISEQNTTESVWQGEGRWRYALLACRRSALLARSLPSSIAWPLTDGMRSSRLLIFRRCVWQPLADEKRIVRAGNVTRHMP